jgi:sulfotransferase
MADITFDKLSIALTGLPLSGCSLMGQLLGHHPRIFSPPFRSPLCGALSRLRDDLADHPDLRVQIDADPDLTAQRMLNAFRGFMNGWFAETPRPVVVDGSPDWLGMIEILHRLDPEFRMIVCVRDLRQIFGAMESRHRRSPLLGFPDGMSAHSSNGRADARFGADGAIGKPLRAIRDLLDLDGPMKGRICYVTFEALVAQPVKTMETIYQWLALPHAPFDPENLDLPEPPPPDRSRFKYQHRIRSRVRQPAIHPVPRNIADRITQEFQWFYDQLYPSLSAGSRRDRVGLNESETATTEGNHHDI